jgi:hypothetical protein
VIGRSALDRRSLVRANRRTSFANRRKAKYKLYLAWFIAIPIALVFDLLLHIGIIEAAGCLRLLALLTTHYVGWSGPLGRLSEQHSGTQ